MLLGRNPDRLYVKAVTLLGTEGEAEGRKAFKLFLKAAMAGHAESQFYVASMYHTGTCTDQDADAAFMWLCKRK